VGHHWQFHHDPAGRLRAQIDWAGRETHYRRDILGRIECKRMPDGAEQRFEWDLRDRISRVVAGEDAISYRYDDHDRLIGATTWLVIDGGDQRIAEVALDYDAKGRLVGETQNGIAIAYRYDDAGRCIGRTSPSGKTALSFDEAGLMTRYESNGHALRFQHDLGGMETFRALAAIGTPTAFQLEQRYDPAGRLAEQRAGGVAAFAPDVQAPSALARHYEWDRVGRLTSTHETGATNGRQGRRRYHYDLRDQAQAVERPGQRETYRYDALMNLAEGLAGEHRYWRDCVVEAGPNRFRYDKRGRMIERILTQDGFRPQRWRYRWDGFDRLVLLEGPNGAHWRYTYDAFGRRTGKARIDAADHRRTDYVWQGQTLAEAWHRRAAGTGESSDGEARKPRVSPHGSWLRVERWHFEADGLRAIAKELVPVGDGGMPSCDQGRLQPIVVDQIGTPHALFDADGTLCWRADAELWGRTRTARALLRDRRDRRGDGDDDDPPSCALRFPGQWEDEESGLHYNLNRYYDPETGQYLSPDPIGVQGGRRTHAYVHDSVHFIDPLGLAECNWGAWYARKTGTTAPAGMPNPHAHHIVFKGDFSSKPGIQSAVGRSRSVTSKYGIDPVNDPDALMWAPNRGHSTSNAQRVASRLEAADARISSQNLPKADATSAMKAEL
jgi:RHS repeat-associated protein